ncbi:PREDICTED: P protein-like [Dinoponera quadriceps]|uniref:P protein-like n=1 Tax=Dinoponera quadriceps TaxID=609295 RepID=A0A6P3X758_DINQU|nr:PREDICTED: P protein-like [Dinoponera quadriceps]
MEQTDTSEDESDLPTPNFGRKNRYSRNSPDFATGATHVPVTPSSITSSVIFGQIPEEVLRVWSQLPEAVRLDPSLALFQREYDRVNQMTGSSDNAKQDYLVVNMSLGRQPAVSIRVPNIRNFNEGSNGQDSQASQDIRQKTFRRYTKLTVLFCCWLIFTIALMFKSEKIETMHQISIPNGENMNYEVHEHVTGCKRIKVTVQGSLLPLMINKQNLTTPYLIIWLKFLIREDTYGRPFDNESQKLENISDVWVLSIPPEHLMDYFLDQRHEKIFELNEVDDETLSRGVMSINFRTNLDSTFPVYINYDLSSVNSNVGIICAALVLIGLYILIIFEIVHRTLAAMLASTMSVGILAALNERPTMAQLVSWIDIDTLLLLFSMMILVGIIAETGIFDWMSVYAYKISGGKMWPLINTLCFFTAFVSSFLDNVTTVLLMTPVTIRLCEVMELNPVPILTAMVVYSNIGGAMTPIGDPPNVIISSNRDVVEAGINFGTFLLHMSIGVILVLIVITVQFRFIYRDVTVLRFDVPQDVQELRHEIAIWQRAAASLSSYSKDENVVRETLLKKAQRLLSRLKSKAMTGSAAFRNYRTTLDELQEKYPIRDKWLLVKSGFVLFFEMTLFFLHSVPNLNLSLGWTALIGILLLLILADSEDLDGLMARVEWSTLVFFASLFILMECLSRLGFIGWIGKQTETIILSVNEEFRLAVAILLLLWVSALASAFVDNVPLTTVMVRIATNLAQNNELKLPLQPLVWSLALGACMGGNGTLIGATANVVCVGVAEQHGYKFNFMQFFRVGFPIMITSTMTITIYLMVAHVIIGWNGT